MIIALILAFIAGIANGVHETVHYHYSGFKKRFPKADDLYWNPMISWKNKYKNGNVDEGRKFFGSTTLLVWTTDAKHLFGTIMRWSLILSAFMTPHWYLLPITFVGFTAGFHLTYTLFFK